MLPWIGHLSIVLLKCPLKLPWIGHLSIVLLKCPLKLPWIGHLSIVLLKCPLKLPWIGHLSIVLVYLQNDSNFVYFLILLLALVHVSVLIFTALVSTVIQTIVPQCISYPIHRFMYPQTLLSHHFWTDKQKVSFSSSRSRESMIHLRGLMGEVRVRASEEQMDLLSTIGRQVS